MTATQIAAGLLMVWELAQGHLAAAGLCLVWLLILD